MKTRIFKKNQNLIQSLGFLIILFLFSFKIIAQDELGGGVPHGHEGNPQALMKASGNTTNESTGYSAGIGFEINRLKNFSYLLSADYRVTRVANATTLRNIEIPAILHYNFSKNFSIGTGAMYSYLTAATVGGRTIDLTNNKDFERSGYGVLAEIEAGSKNLKVGLRYTNRFNAGLTGSSTGIIDVGLRYTFGKK